MKGSNDEELTIHTYPWLTTDARALLDRVLALESERDRLLSRLDQQQLRLIQEHHETLATLKARIADAQAAAFLIRKYSFDESVLHHLDKLESILMAAGGVD